MDGKLFDVGKRAPPGVARVRIKKAVCGGNNWFSCPDTQLINHAMGKIEYIAHLLVGAEAGTGTLHRVQASHKQF